MSRITVRPFGWEDVPTAAVLAAARHRRDRSRLPFLAAERESVQPHLDRIAGLLANPRCTGVLAERDGAPVGYLFGEQQLLAPTELAYVWGPPHSIDIGVDCHAASDEGDMVRVYRMMYAALAAEWVAAGFFVHRWAVTAGDADVAEAAVSLGFGRFFTAATRETSIPVAISLMPSPPLRIDEAGPEDIEIILALSDQLDRHHARSPMFWPLLRTTADAVREHNLAALRGGEAPYFVAHQGGQAVGMQTFLKPGFTPPIVEPATNVYLFDGVVAEDARSGGIGTALLEHSMRWASGAGYSTCTLHFASGNESGAAFWLGHGFTPVEFTMERRIDERIAWAR